MALLGTSHVALTVRTPGRTRAVIGYPLPRMQPGVSLPVAGLARRTSQRIHVLAKPWRSGAHLAGHTLRDSGRRANQCKCSDHLSRLAEERWTVADPRRKAHSRSAGSTHHSKERRHFPALGVRLRPRHAVVRRVRRRTKLKAVSTWAAN